MPALIASIAAYKTNEVEFIVIDGGSTDGTLNILIQNEDLIDYWQSCPDEGIYDAMNKSVHFTKGQWVVFLGADDTLAQGFTNALPLLKDPNTVYYGNVIYYGKMLSKAYDDYFLTKLNICHQAIFYPKAVFEKYKYDVKYKVYADYHLNLRCWKDARFKFVHVDLLIANFTQGGYSFYTKDPVFESDKDMLYKTYLKRKSYYRYLNRSLGFWKMLWRFVRNL
jgi:glycosyltransferase involved in cell wall biosynthesis